MLLMAKPGAANRNKQYLKKLAARLPEIVPTLLAEISYRVYLGVMERTRVDTGQALAQWYVLPTKGERSKYPKQQILWGFGDTEPVSPIGWKPWSRQARGAQNPTQEEMIEYKLGVAASMFTYIRHTPSLKNVLIYNPITPGFAGFMPGNDTKYQETALGLATQEIPNIEAKAREEGYKATKAQFRDLLK